MEIPKEWKGSVYFMTMLVMGNSYFYPYYSYNVYMYVHSSVIGRWSTRGVEIVDELSNDTIITCYSTHLTSFAVLVSPQDERPVSTATRYSGCMASFAYLHVYFCLLAYCRR